MLSRSKSDQSCATRNRKRSFSRQGVIVVLVALLLPAILAMVAFSVDVTFMQLARAELRAATDAAARAGGEALSRLQDVDAARKTAIAIAAANNVGGRPLELANEDIIFGRSAKSKGGNWSFQPGGEPINSLRVRGRRTSNSPSGEINLFFGRAIGARSFQPVQFATVVRLDRDICLVVDRSGSMKIDLGIAEENLASSLRCKVPQSNTRWTALVEAVDAFIAGSEETTAREFISLVSYASDNDECGIENVAASIDARLSEDTSGVTSALDRISNTKFNGATNISAGIEKGIDLLTTDRNRREFGIKTMVLMTDGRHNEGPNPTGAAQHARQEDITIYTVTFGPGANQEDMQRVAEITGGEHFHAVDASQLRDIFFEIGASLPTVLVE